jgi:hypothetical protein
MQFRCHLRARLERSRAVVAKALSGEKTTDLRRLRRRVVAITAVAILALAGALGLAFKIENILSAAPVQRAPQ